MAATEFCKTHGLPQEALNTLNPNEYTIDYFMVGDWPQVWYIFAGYALIVAFLFIFLFKTPKNINEKVA
jgi:hypothetical protein